MNLSLLSLITDMTLPNDTMLYLRTVSYTHLTLPTIA